MWQTLFNNLRRLCSSYITYYIHYNVHCTLHNCSIFCNGSIGSRSSIIWSNDWCYNLHTVCRIICSRKWIIEFKLLVLNSKLPSSGSVPSILDVVQISDSKLAIFQISTVSIWTSACDVLSLYTECLEYRKAIHHLKSATLWKCESAKFSTSR